MRFTTAASVHAALVTTAALSVVAGEPGVGKHERRSANHCPAGGSFNVEGSTSAVPFVVTER